MSTSYSPDAEAIERDRLKGHIRANLEAAKDLYASFELLRKQDLQSGVVCLSRPLLNALRSLLNLVASPLPAPETLPPRNGESAPQGMKKDSQAHKLQRQASEYLEKMSLEDCSSVASSKKFAEDAWCVIRLASLLLKQKCRTELWTPTDSARTTRRILRGFMLTAIAVSVCVGARTGYRQWLFSNFPPHTIQRVQELKKLEAALLNFAKDNKYYPPTNGRWDGLYSSFGQSGADWIPGLVPKYIDALPRDPRNHANGAEQYLYWSDGKTFKVIAHNTPDALVVREFFPQMYDTARPGRSIGVWSDGAANR